MNMSFSLYVDKLETYFYGPSSSKTLCISWSNCMESVTFEALSYSPRLALCQKLDGWMTKAWTTL